MKAEDTGGKFSGSAQGLFLSKGVIKTERWGRNFSQINCYNTGNHRSWERVHKNLYTSWSYLLS